MRDYNTFERALNFVDPVIQPGDHQGGPPPPHRTFYPTVKPKGAKRGPKPKYRYHDWPIDLRGSRPRSQEA